METIEKLADRTQDEELQRLLSYLAADRSNPSLRADAAERAVGGENPEIALQLLGSDREALGNHELGLRGLAEMRTGAFDEAVTSFEGLIDRGVNDPAVRFNLAWSYAAEKEPLRALDQLSPEVAEALPAAAMLEVRLLHELGEFERAADAARRHLERFPNDEGLAATASVLALDIEDRELARRCAKKGGNQPDALVTLGTLALDEQQVEEAGRLFEEALAVNENAPRAWIGRGLTRLLNHDRAAASDIDRGAELFGDHIGSWIAAGWAHLISGDVAAARQRFERALSIDENFGESHGSLAVVDLLEGQNMSAQRRIAVALRLDPQSFSARFAKTLLAERSGDAKGARASLESILQTPVNARGDNAAAALARLGLR